jgi:hypothetical protein
MDDNLKLLLDLAQKKRSNGEGEPIMQDVKSLLEEARKRVYTAEGQKLVDSARRINEKKT